MSMLRIATLIHFATWNNRQQIVVEQQQAEDECTSLLILEETLLKKHHGAILLQEPNTFVEQVVEQDQLFKNQYSTHEIQQELVAILKFAIPLIITFLLGFGSKVVDVWFLGQVGSEVMAVASLGSLFTTVAGLSVGQGILTAIDTLVAQAFTGASNPKTLGTILQRALVIIYLFGTCIAFLWTFAERILLSMGQTPELASNAQSYISIMIPFIFLNFTICSIRKFLQGLGEMRVTMYLILLAFPLNIISNYYFLIYVKLGFIGAAYHVVISGTFLLFIYILLIFLVCKDIKKYWPGWTIQAFQNWTLFLKLGIPGMLSVSTDWAFEVCAIIAGVLGKTSLAAQHVVLTVNTLLLMIPSAITTALIVRLGHHLGANQPKKTKLCVMLSTLLGFIFVMMNACFMYTYRSFIAHFFSKDPAVIEAIEDLMLVGCLSHFALGFGTVLSGTLNAFGKQHVVASINLVSYYMIGLPFGFYMTYHHGWGLIGIWSGVVLSGIVKTLVEALIITFYINWEQECMHAVHRINKQEI